MSKQIFIWIFILFSPLMPLHADDVNLTLSQQIVGINESFSVIFSCPHSISGHPDFSPLDTDFKILSQSQSFKSSIFNGQVAQESRWTLTLMGKREGNLTIPSISFGQHSSQPKTIEVTSAQTTKQDDTLFLETELSPKNSVYEQTQLIFTVRLYRSVNISQGMLSEPKANDSDASIERLGKDLEYEHYHSNGARYIVLERNYAVFPQKSGELIFDPITFEGRVIIGNGRSFFNSQSQFMRVVSKQEKIDVKPIPAPFTKSNWFAANDVKLIEEWSTDPDKIILGEPITWTLTVAAEGCLGNQIPALSLNLPAELKQYLDKPQTSNDKNMGKRQEKVALIATKSGTFSLPEVNIKWWDLKSDQLRETLLPARTIHVQAAPLADQIAMNAPSIEEKKSGPIEQPVLQQPPQELQTIPMWAWILIGLNIIWITGLPYLLYKNKNFAKTPPQPDSLKQVHHLLKKACKNNDAKQAEAALLAWAQKMFPQERFRSIMSIKKQLPKELQEAIDDLNQALYGSNNNWQGESFWLAFSSFKPIHQPYPRKNREAPLLRELYPN